METTHTAAPTMTAREPLPGDRVEEIRAQFPILRRTLADGAKLVYLDSGATAQRPERVIDAMARFDRESNSAVHRGAHQLAAEATAAYEEARAGVAGFVGAHEDEIVWTKNATEGLNVLALALSEASAGLAPHLRMGAAEEVDPRLVLGPGDSVVITELEHHANIVPWQMLCRRTGARLRWIGVTDDGRLDPSTYDVIDETTRVLAVTGASNVTGALTDVPELVARARALGGVGTQSERGPIVVLDACQLAPHVAMDMHALDVDAAVFSSHKMFGPTGIGVLYGRRELLAALPPVLTGGSMVDTVTMDETTVMPAPARFEAGSQPITQVVGLHEAVRFLEEIGMDAVAAHEAELARLLVEGIAAVPGVRVLGPTDLTDPTSESPGRLAVVAFEVEGVHPHDVGQLLDSFGVAVRVGHHCAQPVHRRLGVPSSARATASIYNTAHDIEVFLEALGKVRAFFGLEGSLS